MIKPVLCKLVFPLLILSCPTSCLDTIEIDPKVKQQESIVIDGRMVYGDTTRISVQVSRLFNFQPGQVAPLDVRSIQVLDEQGNALELKPTASGRYEKEIILAQNPFPFQIGSYYHLVVETKRGLTYKSKSDQLLDTPSGQLNARIIQKPILNEAGTYHDQDFVAFNIDMPIVVGADDFLNRFKFNFERIYRHTDNQEQVCYVFQEFNISDLVLFDANTLSFPGEVPIPLIDERAWHLFAEGYYLTMRQESMSEAAYEYWKNVQTLLTKTGSMFEPPVGQVAGNIYSEEDDEAVFGYFYVTTERLYRLYISPEFAGNPIRLCPNPGQFQGKTCMDCLKYFPKSQLEKPDFWID